VTGGDGAPSAVRPTEGWNTNAQGAGRVDRHGLQWRAVRPGHPSTARRQTDWRPMLELGALIAAEIAGSRYKRGPPRL